MSDAQPTPGLPRRLVAMLYDSLLVVPMTMAAIAASLAAGSALSWLEAGGQLPPWLVWLLGLGCSTLFFCVFWRRGGQTLGMQAWRLRLVRDDGERPGWRQCLLRCAAALLSFVAFGCGFWWCLVDARRRAWHDHLSGTHLVLLPKRSRS